MDVRLLLFLFLLVSCVPAAVNRGNLTSDDGTTPGSGTPTSTADTKWNYLGNLTTDISINASNLNNAYIVGSNIEKFLAVEANFKDKTYCFVSRYSLAGLTHELRSRVVPISYYDFTLKRTVRLLRVDFDDVANSDAACVGQPLKVLSSSGTPVSDTATINAVTPNPGLVCTTCSGILSATKTYLFKIGLGELEEIPSAQIDIRTLKLSVNPANTTTSNPGSCSKSECAARGFDCCLENQCITDGAVRPTARASYPTELAVIEQERLSNPMIYLNHPHLYYICGATTPTTTTGSSTGGSYETGLTQLKKDYFCIEHMKKYKLGASFHQDLLTGLQLFPNNDEPDIPDVVGNASTLYPLDIECRNNTDTASNMHYLKVVERLYKNCGCAKTTITDMVNFCPSYEYKFNYLENGIPNRIDCLTPPTSGTPTVPTQQTVSLNSRAAPHRYFRSCGEEFGGSGTCATGDAQEGDVFAYQDVENVLSTQEDFGMNGILGQMNVTLDKALPAKTVTIELDQVYQISTTSGFYSPCPACGKDSWFASFMAYPNSSYGTGLQAVGHSTSRDGYDFNTTGGNYEDTIFGRACWIPPTMLPFSHHAYGTTQSQRLTRLKTQAALYANGYQRDWYGFNKGALIGSFDGVSWFAVGKGRIVRSTSKKLFLSINAPFADLASPTLHVVNVQAYDGISQAPQIDYDPTLHLSHPLQNEAGNCQANHLCNTDTDCVSRLGWEYMCADVQGVTTKWPQFDVDAKEKVNASSTFTLDQILHQKRFPSAATKRCVYRGAGSLCVPNSTTITDLNKRKTLTCAPNFYCANINSGSVFNSKVSRYAGKLEEVPVPRNHLFGKDANVLGRPLSYTASSLTKALPADVRVNLSQNMVAYQSTASASTGLCLPGKILPDTTNQASLFNPYEQHRAADSLGRTDFISQVGGCNSSLFSANRYASCPVMGADGNYEFLSTTFNLTTYSANARTQNSCGLDSLLTGSSLNTSSDLLSANSPFRAIEAKPLITHTTVTPSIARDACLRRAGSVCHTDLDCGPNKFHAEQAENFSLAYFGNEAEKKYYSEYLVCGQTAAKPTPSDSVAYKDYQMNKNRCCREVGSDLTTFTSYTPQKLLPLQSTNLNASISDDDYQTSSFGLKTSQMPGTAPNDKLRYSRLATVGNLGSAERPILNAYQDRITDPMDPTKKILGMAQSSNVMTPYQWKTLSEANSESCCGGGWVRKFSDGSNDWTRRDRVYLDVKNFACINSRSVMLTRPDDVASQYNNIADAQSLANQDYGDYCKDALRVKGWCAQNTVEDTLADVPPTLDAVAGFSGGWKSALMNFSASTPNRDFYFYPRSADGDPAIIIDYTKVGGRRNISLKVPSYITRTSSDNGLTVTLFNMAAEATGPLTCFSSPSANLFSPTDPGMCGSPCCYYYDPVARVLKVIANPTSSFGWQFSGQNKKIAVKVDQFQPAGLGVLNLTRFKAGSNSHYLRRLGKLELSGIPQINYEALRCSDNSDRLVPGLFKMLGVPDPRITHFNQDTFSFPTSYTDPDTGAVITSRYTNRYGLDHEPVFSENDFKCCTPMGKTTNDKTKCCSGFGILSPSQTVYTCALPEGTDLMVYLNRFVTNEGVGADQPAGGLLETDFNLLTGEPKLTTTVNQKIAALGQAYCQHGKVRLGGAFGAFKLEPEGSDTNQNEEIYGIVDSSNDLGVVATTGGNVEVGYNAFMTGFRWNHHLYCDDE